MKDRQVKRYYELDSLRGIAAILVLLFHLFPSYLAFGVTGVDLFFIISGFVIFLTLEKTKVWEDFALSRFARLYPVYWTAVTITFLLTSFNTHHVPLLQYLVNLTMFQHDLRQQNLDGTYWTLNVEMKFYILMLSIFILKKLHKIEVIGCLLLLFTFFMAFVFRSNRIVQAIIFRVNVCDYWPLFFSGIIFYKIKFEDNKAYRWLILALCFLMQIGMFTVAGPARENLSIVQYLFVVSAYYFLFVLYVFDMLRFIINRVAVFLGKISYSLYLVHGYLSIAVINPVMLSHGYHPVISGLTASAASITIAYLITTYIEQPGMTLIKNYYNKRYRMA